MLNKRLGQILKEMEVVSEYDVQQALDSQRESGESLGSILKEMGLLNDEQLYRALAAQNGMEYVDLAKAEIPPEVLELVDSTTAETFQVMPVEYDGATLIVATAKPDDLTVIDDLRFSLPTIQNFKAQFAPEESIQRAIEKYYGQNAEGMDGLFDGLGKDAVGQERESIDIAQVEADANAAPVVKLLNMILLQAIRDRSADIHLEPFEHEFKVRYRVDGVLYEMMPPPIHLARAVISRVKVMANLDIAETRLPQDGRIELNIGGNPVDLRVSTLPTMYGESVVMRILDRQNLALNLEALGLRPDELEVMRKLCAKPNGIILVTGPT
ncbi:MAG: Flp pilus assembly complex ATPase component TadA, partial [Planctomycetes bacterium]|nr:Flp pilus assembly complex ATPase component TadA [Planctomycetota bacterium]